MKKVSIIIPVFNEKNYILETLRQIEALVLPGLEKEIIFVDDGSTDGSREILSGLKDRAKIVLQPKNRGVGAAMRAGIGAATGDYILRQDVDLEYAVSNIPGLLRPLIEGKADAVYGSRVLGGHESHSKFYHACTIAVNFLFFNLLYWNRIYNFTTAAKAFRREVFGRITLVEDGFETESEISAKLLRSGFRVVNVPILYKPRTYAEGKKMRWYYTFRILWTLVKYRFVPVHNYFEAREEHGVKYTHEE